MKMSELYSAYWDRHAKVRLKSPANVYYWWSAHKERWAGRDVEQIQSEELQEWFDDLAAKSKSAAVRAIAVMSSMISWGIRRKLVQCDNQCRYVDKIKLKPRRRFLMPDEIERFKAALLFERKDIQDIFWLCLLTGARRGNVLSMEWGEIDSTLKLWMIPAEKHKNDECQINVLTDAALAILDRRRRTSKSEYVFPSEGVRGHRVCVKKPFMRILARADISNFRIHDLRRTHGAYMAINGESAYVIGKALGHIDPRSTAVYAQLNMTPVRNAVNRAQDNYL